jgi:hypothetical protein
MATALPTIASSPVTQHNCRWCCSCFAAVGGLRSATARAFCLAALLSTACTTGVANFTVFNALCCSPLTLCLRRLGFGTVLCRRAFLDVACSPAPSIANSIPIGLGPVERGIDVATELSANVLACAHWVLILTAGTCLLRNALHMSIAILLSLSVTTAVTGAVTTRYRCRSRHSPQPQVCSESQSYPTYRPSSSSAVTTSVDRDQPSRRWHSVVHALRLHSSLCRPALYTV